MEDAKINRESQSATSTGISFGFSKTIVKKSLESSVINETEKVVAEEKSSSLRKEKEEKPVIPVIPGKWNLQRQADRLRTGSKSVTHSDYIETGDEVTDRAVKEILSDITQNENTEKLSIAIVTQNGETTDSKSHINRGQVEEVNREIQEEEYEKIDVQQFGMAMLRGMGWKDEEKSSTKLYEVRPRPVALGLGANVPTHSAAYEVKKQREDKKEENLTLKPGAYCQVLSGKLEGQYGTVTSIQEDAVRVYVTMALSGDVVSLSQYAIQLVTKAEYDKEHRCINKKSVERYKSDNGEYKTNKTNGVKREHSEDRRRKDDDVEGKQRRKEETSSSDSKKSTHRDRDERSPKKSKHTSSPSWIHPCLRVRFVDEKYKHGKYFKTKVIIVDVISKDLCICRTENGHLLEDIRQDQLETVIPHDRTSLVMIVSGSHRSQMAEIVEKDKKQCKVVVQLLPDKDEIVTLDYDCICEYVGDIE